MSTSVDVHLHTEDQWLLQDCTRFPEPFVSMTVHDIVILYVRPGSVDALIAAAEKAKTILDKVRKEVPS